MTTEPGDASRRTGSPGGDETGPHVSGQVPDDHGRGPPGHLHVEVFVSYASQDAAVANAIVAVLERHGLRCWIAPRDVVPGSLYADGIVRAINDARVFALVLSEHAVASQHVGKEIERASSKRRPIIALRTDLAPLTPAFEYFLSESQWIDIGPGGTDAAAAKLLEAVRRYLEPATARESRAAVAADRPQTLTAAAPAAAGRATATLRINWMVSAAFAVVALALASNCFRASSSRM